MTSAELKEQMREAKRRERAERKAERREAARDGKGLWERIRGTAIVFALLSLIPMGLLVAVFVVAITTLGKPYSNAEFAIWTSIVVGTLNFIAGFVSGFLAISHLRADERKPAVPQDYAMESMKYAHAAGMAEGNGKKKPAGKPPTQEELIK